MKYTKDQIAEARAVLSQLLPPGATIYTILRHVSRSGMMRHISCVVFDQDGPNDITWYVARVLGSARDRSDGGIKEPGCGMDLGFHVVMNLGYALYPNGYECIGEGCPSNDHSNGDANRKPHHHKSGGYALKQRWL